MNWWIEEYKKYHAELNTNYPGNNLKPQLHHIKDLVKDTKAESLLDFGCGKGLQYTKYNHHEELGIMPALYDPAVPEYENLPKPNSKDRSKKNNDNKINKILKLPDQSTSTSTGSSSVEESIMKNIRK